MNRRLAAGAFVLCALLVGWLRWPGPEQTRPDAPAAETAKASAPPQRSQIVGTPAVPGSSVDRAQLEPTVSTLADALNAPERDVAADLVLLSAVFESFRTNFPQAGNPVGDNPEITAALTGKNGLRLAAIAPDHRAINPRGELCDRWGTPFFFHQLSGTDMEIRSAGPDRTFHTADDAVLTP